MADLLVRSTCSTGSSRDAGRGDGGVRRPPSAKPHGNYRVVTSVRTLDLAPDRAAEPHDKKNPRLMAQVWIYSERWARVQGYRRHPPTCSGAAGSRAMPAHQSFERLARVDQDAIANRRTGAPSEAMAPRRSTGSG